MLKLFSLLTRWAMKFTGVPAKGLCGEMRRSETDELCRLRRREEYGACSDEAETEMGRDLTDTEGKLL